MCCCLLERSCFMGRGAGYHFSFRAVGCGAIPRQPRCTMWFPLFFPSTLPRILAHPQSGRPRSKPRYYFYVSPSAVAHPITVPLNILVFTYAGTRYHSSTVGLPSALSPISHILNMADNTGEKHTRTYTRLLDVTQSRRDFFRQIS